MGILKLIELFVTIVLTTTNCYTISPISSNNKWFARDLTTEQGLHSLLASIEDKLRTADSVRFGINRLETTIARMSSKLDSIESQLSTVHTAMHIKMREVYEVLLKHDFQREQMTHKCEATQSRLLHKINLLENRFEDSFQKLQGNPEVNLGKIENKQNDVINKIVEINSNINAIKTHNLKIEDKINSTENEIMQHFKNSQYQLAKKDHMDILENKINGLHSRLNKSEFTWTQNDSPKGTNLEQEQLVNNIKSELRSETQKIGNKVNNMYNDLWKKISLVENLLKENIMQTNITQKDLQEELQQIVTDQRDNEGFQDLLVDNILTVIQKNFNDLYRRFENNFQSLVSAQSGAYQKLHEDQSEYEQKIGLILEKILDTFLNKTNGLSKQNTQLLEALKGHNSQMTRNVADAKDMVITLAEENSYDHKKLDNSIIEVVKRADIIAEAVEELQEQFDEINETRYIANTLFTNITPLTDILTPDTRKHSDDLLVNGTNTNNANKTINAIEANFNNGILKIITDDLIPKIDKREESFTDIIKENMAEINLNNNSTKIDKIEEYLNKALSTSNLTTIITSPIIIHKINQQENFSDTLNQSLFQNENYTNIPIDLRKKDINKTKQSEEIETTFILSYINFIKGHITKDEFLQETYPGKTFKSIHEMLTYIKPLRIIRNEYLRELDKYDREESESEIVGRRHDAFIDATNFEYEDSSDEFMTSNK